jgi:hypothetical protein
VARRVVETMARLDGTGLSPTDEARSGSAVDEPT